MTTIYQRLIAYQEKTGAFPLNHIHKSTLGRLISAHWYNIPSNPQLTLTRSIEDTGTFKVLAYPDSFSDTMDELIYVFYKSINKKRKRKPIIKSIWSVKPSKKE